MRRWDPERFLRLPQPGFCGPASYLHRYAGLSVEEAEEEAGRIWDRINGPNLAANIAPTRARASLVLRKGGDHSVSWVRLRKI